MNNKIKSLIAQTIIGDREELLANSTSVELLLHCTLVVNQAEEYLNSLITDVVNITLKGTIKHKDEDEFKEELLKSINASEHTQLMGGMLALLQDALMQVSDEIIAAKKAGKLEVKPEDKVTVQSN